MTLRLYNTLARAKQEFRPLDPAQVRLYVCGPTVYDYAHIGNARPAIVFDLLFRLLRHHYGADHVTYVRNITDVDDKINARALRDHPGLPLNEAIRRVTEPTAKQYRTDVEALGCLPPTHEPRATDFVLPRADGRADMTGLIQSLLDRGNAYVAEGEVLFDTRSMPDYGALSRRPLDEQQAGARVAVDAHKRHPADFVLWKQSSADEPGWDARFTVEGQDVAIRGRPGWHIECSAMSAAYLGEVFDIHGGGLDLIFPHHENEIAQSRCAHGTHAMANLWMHNGFVQVEGRKMSKSEGNFVTIHDLLETEAFGGRRWPGAVLRLAMLSTHYREPIDFSLRKLEESENLLQRWRRRLAEAGCETGEVPGGVLDALGNDLDMARFLELVSGLFNVGQWADDDTRAAEYGFSDAFLALPPERRTTYAIASAGRALDLVGITLEQGRSLTAEEQAAIAERLALIRDKNWAEADRIRDTLLSAGIRLKDGKDPASGERVTSWEFLS